MKPTRKLFRVSGVYSHVPEEQGRAVVELVCVECSRAWLDPRERWRLYVIEEDEPLTLPYCPDCAGAEFDEE